MASIEYEIDWWTWADSLVNASVQFNVQKARRNRDAAREAFGHMMKPLREYHIVEHVVIVEVEQPDTENEIACR